MKLVVFVLACLFCSNFSTDLMASRPAIKIIYPSKSINLVLLKDKIEKKSVFVRDSVQAKVEILPPKPKKNGLGMIIGGVFLALLGLTFGIGLLFIFLLGFTIGSGFYFKDIYAIAGVMLSGLVVLGLGIYMISRGSERWRAYKKYKKALKKMQQTQ